MNPRKALAATLGFLLGALLLSGCGLIYTNIHLPYSYNSATPIDVHPGKDDPQVTGQACYRTAVFLVAWGNAGYIAATQKALAPYPGSTLYDVKSDLKVDSYVFGLYTRECIVVTGRVAKS